MKSFTRSFVLTFVALVFVLAFTVPAAAQDSSPFPTNTTTPEFVAGLPAAEATEIVVEQPVEAPGEGGAVVDEAAAGRQSLADMFQGIIEVLLAGGITGILGLASSRFGAGKLLDVLVGTLKRIPALQRYSSATLLFWSAMAVVGTGSIAVYFNFEAFFSQGIGALAIIIPTVLTFYDAQIQASKAHEKAAAQGLGGVLGGKRTTPELTMAAKVGQGVIFTTSGSGTVPLPGFPTSMDEWRPDEEQKIA